jgi:hypothetical protein
MDNDFPRLINLSHPLLRPEKTPEAIRHYTQRYVDVIDLERNTFATIEAREVLGADFAPMRWLASLDDGDTLMPLYSVGPHISRDRLVLTFDSLLEKSDFALLLKTALARLAKEYGGPVDVEFAISLQDGPRPALTFHLLQCRPQYRTLPGGQAARPAPIEVPEADRLFQTSRLAPQGNVTGVEYVVYVDLRTYHQLAEPTDRREVARLIGRLNKALEGRTFILVGPGRWGSSNDMLGVPVSYADIFNASALVEVAAKEQGLTPDPSYGTHFFQDLVEARIYPLAIFPDEAGDSLNEAMLKKAANRLLELLPNEQVRAADCVKVFSVPKEYRGRCLNIDMDGERAIAYLAPADQLTRPA